MNRLTSALLIASAVLMLAGCGGGGAGTGAGTTDTVSLATRMINEATSEECPTQAHCILWSVESLATVDKPDDQKANDL